MTKTVKFAIECPNNLNPTFVDHGLGYPLNVRVFALAVINGWLFTPRIKGLSCWEYLLRIKARSLA